MKLMPLTNNTNYVSFINNGFSEEALRRSYAEQWFPIRRSPCKGIIQRRFKRYNAEGQYNNNWVILLNCWSSVPI
jgi:hypothetical protein